MYDSIPPQIRAQIIRSCNKYGISSPEDVETAYNNFTQGKSIFEGLSDSFYRAQAFKKFLEGGVISHKYSGEDEPTGKMTISKLNKKSIVPVSVWHTPKGYTYNLPEVTVTPQSNPDDMLKMRRAINQGMNKAGEIGAAAVAAGLAPYIASASVPVITNAASYLAPGSSFWKNPATKQMAASILGGETINTAVKQFTPFNSVGEGLSKGVENITGWNPSSTILGSLAMESLNPGYYTPYNIAAKGITGIVENANKLSQVAASPHTGKWTPFGSKEYRLSPNALGVNGIPLESKSLTGTIEGFEGINVPEGYTPVKVLKLKTKDGYRTIHQVQEKSTGKFKNLEDMQFKSELDWSPKSWYEEAGGRKYKDNSSTQYTDQDIKDLESHIPEYIEIERRSKANGTWLRMPDGSMWEGDPRSWVQYMSRAAQEAANGQPKEAFWTGIHKTVDSNYNGRLWGLTVQNQSKLAPAKAATYTRDDAKVMPMFTVKYENPEAISTVNAKGYDWHAIPYNDKFVKTDYVVDDIFSRRGKKVVKIDNVRDTGTERVVPSDSKYYYEGIGNDVRVPQNNIILNDGTLRKALVGGNGNFKHPTHIYRSLIPLSLVESLMESSGD